ncbi:MAG: sugar transferase [Verrucomicrobiales bacterium]|nr:sugar transferase [Verrucomicrobiales bacterium]
MTCVSFFDTLSRDYWTNNCKIIKTLGKTDQPLKPISAMSNPQWKRRLDCILVVVALPVLLPLMMLIALIIRMVSAGPVLFKQERVGYLGGRFLCYKFRTMFVNADTGIHQGHLDQLMSSDAPMMKMDSKGDPRIIPFGRLLRASGLDELPQLINVLCGDMSLVGPRPCVSYEYEKYLPWQRERFNTLPGLTGLWQVSGKNQTTFTEMIELDIKYARNKTLWLDLKIIFKTVPALMIQMWEMRVNRSLRPQLARLRKVGSAHSGNQGCFSKTLFAAAASGGTDTEHRRK